MKCNNDFDSHHQTRSPATWRRGVRTIFSAMSRKRARRWIVLVALVGVWPGAADGGDAIEFDSLSLEDGLSQSIVERIVQDRQGFMWFATEDGLNRFDGYRFTVHRHDSGNPQSLSYNELKALYEDRDGRLWVGTFENGLNAFDPATETVVRFLPDPTDASSLSSPTVWAVLEDSSGRLWVGTQGGGLELLDRDTGRFIHHRADPSAPGSISSDDVRAIYEDRNGGLWIGTNGGGLNRLDDDGRFTHYRHSDDDPATLSDDRVFAILEDRSGRLWVGTYGGGLDLLDRETGRFTHFRNDPDDHATLSNDLVRALCEDREGTLWVGTDGGGLNRYHPETGSFSSYRHDPLEATSLTTDRIYSLYQDRSNVLWVGTYGGGLSFFDVSRKRFHSYRNDPGNSNSLSHDIVWTFHEDPDGTLWIGTDSGGLNRFDRGRDRWQRYLHRPDDPRSLSHNTVRAVFGDRQGRLWVATNGGGLNLLDRATGHFTHYRHDPDDPTSLSHDRLRWVSQDSSGAIWVGTFGGGLDLLDPETGTFTHFSHDPDDPTSISHDFIRLVYEDSRGVRWIGTQGGGLNRLDPGSTEFLRYRHDPGEPSGLLSDHVFGALEDRNGAMWFGTFGGGVSRLDRDSGRFTHYRVVDGLAADSVYAMLEDDQGRLWISTTKGLSRFDPETETFRNFDVRDGLQSNEFNGGSAYRNRSGELFFGGINGFNVFDPAEIGNNPVVPEVVLTDLQLYNRSISVGEEIDGRVLLDRPMAMTEHLVLSHSDDVITIEFAALHYTVPGKNLYAYRMEGFSDDWVHVDADRRFATFTDLRPGLYVFSVRGANSDGIWNDEPTSLTITVTPPFWETWWFRLVALAGLAALAAATYQSRLRSVRMKTQLTAAHDAQLAIMPQAPPDLPGIDIACAWIPAYGVGGDFYDTFWLEGEPKRLGIVVADVAGKGMRAAMNAVMSDGMVFSRARQSGSVEEIMDNLNRSIYHKVGRRMFTALCLVVLDPETRKLEFSNAGLCEPLHRTSSGTEYLASAGSHLPLGVREVAGHEATSLTLADGDIVALFTDGVPEAQNRDGELYGYDAPRQLLAGLDTTGRATRDIIQHIIDDVERFRNGARASDDMAIVVIRVVDSSPSE
jgi:ligand-binding sensor domain-containing protein/serine phosphatase RsbU (regulator of sigma subunit)